MISLRREPFRLLFPLAALLAWIGVLPWLLVGAGVLHRWLGLYHALTMTQGFVVAVAAGFLGTMIPRRTGAPPLSRAALVLLVAGLAAVPIALYLDRVAVAEAGYLVVLVTLLAFVARSLVRKGMPKAPPPSFVLIPIGLASGLGGATLLLLSALGAIAAPAWAGIARGLVEEGLLLALVLAIAPMLTPAICDDGATARPPAHAARQRLLYGLAGLVLVGSFFLQAFANERAGLLVRGVVVAVALFATRSPLASPTVPGLHRRLYALSLGFVPLGLVAAGAAPALRVPLLHLTFIAGLALLVFAVTFHVTFLHTGREHLASASPWPVAVVGLCTVAAAIARVTADRVPTHYFQALLVAAVLWLCAALAWLVYLSPLWRRPSREA